MSFNRSKIKLSGRYEQQVQSIEDKGIASSSYFKAPAGVGYYSIGDTKDGYQTVNFLPFRIGSPKHPEVAAGRAKVGDYDFVLDVFVHRNLGPGKKSFICPQKTYGKPCPVCQEVNKLYDAGQEDAARALRASRRAIYAVQVVDEKGHGEDKVRVLDVSHYGFAKDLMSTAASLLRGKGVIPFADLDGGKLVTWKCEEQTIGKNGKWQKATTFQFDDRQEEIPDSLLEQVPSLDEGLIIPTADQLEKAMYGEDEGGGDEPPIPVPALDPVEEGAEEKPAPVRRVSRQDPIEDEPAPVHRTLHQDPVEEEPAPAHFRGHSPAAPEEPREEDMQVDFDQPPAHSLRGSSAARTTPSKAAPSLERVDRTGPAAPTESAANSCPSGLDFGKDCDSSPKCARCPAETYDHCFKCHGR